MDLGEKDEGTGLASRGWGGPAELWKWQSFAACEMFLIRAHTGQPPKLFSLLVDHYAVIAKANTRPPASLAYSVS